MKLIKKLIGFLVGIVVICLIIAGAFAYMAYDGKNLSNEKYLTYETTLDKEIHSLMVDATKSTKDDGMILATLDETKLNYLLVSVKNSVNTKLKESGILLEGFETTLKDDHSITLYTYVNVKNIYKLSLSGNVTITSTEDLITMKLNNAKLSKLNASNKLIGTTTSFFVSQKKIDEVLKDSDVKFDVNVKELSVSIGMDEIQNQIYKLIGTSKDAKLYQTLISILFTNNILDFDFNDDSKLGMKLDTNSLASDDALTNPYSYDYESLKTKVITLIENDVANYQNVSTIYSYLINGYNRIKEEEGYDILNSLDFSSIGINDYTQYEGIIGESSFDFTTSFENQMPTTEEILQRQFGFKIYEQDLNNLFSGLKLTNKAFAFYKEESTIELSLIYLESLYCSIENNKMILNININLNGKRLMVRANLSSSSQSGLGITASIDSIYFGSILLEENDTKNILSFLEACLNEQPWIKVSADNQTITMSFDAYLDNSIILSSILQQFTSTSTTFKEGSPNGYILISYGI